MVAGAHSPARARWRAHWIGAQEDPVDAEPATGFSRALFRRTFELSEAPVDAPTRVCADARYVLWVNGSEVGRGPARSQSSRKRYDTYDIAPYLIAGPNVLAVVVTYYGQANSLWQPPPDRGVGGDAVLLFEAELGERALVSDEKWRVHRSPAWHQPSTGSGDPGVPVEILDARELPRKWQESAFDDTSWPSAAVRTAAHIGGLARSQPPTFPFGRLRARSFSQLTGTRVEPVCVLDSSRRAAPTWSSDHPVDRVQQVLLKPVLTRHEATLPATFRLEPEQVQHLMVNFGRIVAGFVELDLNAPAGTTVELHYRERPFRPERADDWLQPQTGARYVARGGADTFAALEINGLRYAHLVVHTPHDTTVTIKGIEVREHLYPHTGGAYFRSDDPALDTLYQAGVRTVAVNAFDAFTDCPTREQRAVVGDGIMHQLVHLTTNEDWGLARHYVDLADSPRSDGLLPIAVAGDLDTDTKPTIPDGSLSWIHGVYTLYWHDGELDRVRAHLPTIERVLRWYADYRDDRGTINDVPEWNQVDWSSIFLSGRSSVLTALWARGLHEFAELSDAVGNAGAAQWARELHTAAADGFENFWDPERSVYVDHTVDDAQRPAASQAAGAAAIVSGLAPEDRWAPIIDVITDPARLVVRSWMGNDPGGAAPGQLTERMPGLQRADWDTQRETVRAEPFFSYVVHDAVAQAGRAERIVDLVRHWDQFLTDGYDTFGECWNWGTPAHGWSSTPTRDLITHVLGISPDLPGYTRARIAPRPGPLREFAGAVPTPHGPIEVHLHAGELEINSPVPVVVVREDGTKTQLPPGTRHVSLQ